jgi:hypothetical protein
MPNVAASVPTRKFIKLKMKEFENHYFIGQVVNELRSIYLGAPYEYKIQQNIFNDGEFSFFSILEITCCLFPIVLANCVCDIPFCFLNSIISAISRYSSSLFFHVL